MAPTSYEEEDCHHDLLDHPELQTLQPPGPSAGSDPPVHPELVRRHHGHRGVGAGAGANCRSICPACTPSPKGLWLFTIGLFILFSALYAARWVMFFRRSATDLRALHRIDVLRHHSHGPGYAAQRFAAVRPAALGRWRGAAGRSAVVAGRGDGSGLRCADSVHDVHAPGTQHRPDDRRLAVAGGRRRSRRRPAVACWRRTWRMPTGNW